MVNPMDLVTTLLNSSHWPGKWDPTQKYCEWSTPKFEAGELESVEHLPQDIATSDENQIEILSKYLPLLREKKKLE